MGYSTDFSGEFKLDRPLTYAHREYLAQFSYTRRVKRDVKKTELLLDGLRIAAGLPVGEDGSYYVGESDSNFGQDLTPDIVDYDSPPSTQPGLWCQWTPNSNGTAIVWDEGEKFYHYVEWIEYLIKYFLAPWQYRINGEVEWQGEERDDIGKIIVRDNAVIVKTGKVIYV